VSEQANEGQLKGCVGIYVGNST